MRKLWILGCVVFGIIFLQLLVNGDPERPRPGEVKVEAPYQFVSEKRTAVGVLRQQLKDPESLQTRNVIAVRRGQWDFVCGEYNAKNSFGGYVGFKKFAWRSNGDFGTEGDQGPAYAHQFWLACIAGDSAPAPRP